MIKYPDKNKVRKARHDRMRNKLEGTPARPRLNVYRSLKHIYAQVTIRALRCVARLLLTLR